MDFCAFQLILEYFVTIKSSKIFMKNKRNLKKYLAKIKEFKEIFRDWPEIKEYKGTSCKIKEWYMMPAVISSLA